MRQTIEQVLGTIGSFCARRWWLTFPLFLLYTFYMAGFMGQMQISSKGVDFIPQSDPLIPVKLAHEEQFGSSEYLLILIDTKKTGGVFEKPFLEKLAQLHDELESKVGPVDYIDSLSNARNTRGVEGGLQITEMLYPFPDSAEQIEAIRVIADNNPLIPKQFYSENHRYAAIAIKLHSYEVREVASDEDFFGDQALMAMEETPREMASQQQVDATLAQVELVIAQYHVEDEFEILLAGSPYITSVGNKVFGEDFGNMFLLSLLVVSIFLFICFRTYIAVVAPLVVAVFSTLSAFGLMVLMSNPLLASIATMPSFLVAVAVSGSVHLLTIYINRLTAGDDKSTAIRQMMAHSGLPIMLTALTTAIGLYAFSFSDIPPAAEFGLLAAIAILNTLMYILLFLPALLYVLPVRTLAKKGIHRHSILNMGPGLMEKIARFSTRHYKGVIAFFIVTYGIAFAGFHQLSFSYDPIGWFGDETAVVKGNRLLNEEFGGSLTVETVIDFGKENALHDPENLRMIESVTRLIQAHEVNGIRAKRVNSLIDINKEIHQALQGGAEEHYRLADNKTLIAQELILFQNAGRDDVLRFADEGLQKARIMISLPQNDLLLFKDYIEGLNTTIAETHPDLNFYIVNEIVLFSQFMGHFVKTMVESYSIAFVVIGLLMVFMFGFRLGLISMLPNLWPIVIAFGVMCLLHVPFDLNTLLLGGTVLGLAVDDTIHYMYGYRRYYQKSNDPLIATKKTLGETGVALFLSTIILSLGFLVFAFAQISMTQKVGYLAASAIVLALISDLFFAPALMAFRHHRQQKKKKSPAAV